MRMFEFAPAHRWGRALILLAGIAGVASPVARASADLNAQPLPPPGIAGPLSAEQRIGACIEAAAAAYRIPPVVIVILLHVEGGELGGVHRNANGTVDIGPMQINQIWLPTLARHWHASVHATYAALEDNFCANVAGGSWILHRAIEEARGHLWGGVAYYHSHTLDFETDYLRAVLHEVRHLQAEMRIRDREGS
ncbi:MAG: lytic transglycosylase domain-containing protein [Acidiphilium sp.]|nr:lytic transglycosylase domain-containing protein [Acidiphilium sp.]MDD4937077.1 lytic transglycosylase domain-containing protein [Acidiphilium sp.]